MAVHIKELSNHIWFNSSNSSIVPGEVIKGAQRLFHKDSYDSEKLKTT